MLKINLILLPRSNTNNVSDIISLDAGNMSAQNVYEDLVNDCKGTECKLHPDVHSFIHVKAINGGVPEVFKGVFCCEYFFNSIHNNWL